MPHEYLTCFDSQNLVKGLAMLNSLLHYDTGSKIRVVCLDQTTLNMLEKLNIADVLTISLSEVVKNDLPLLRAMINKTTVAYYWAFTASILLHCMKTMEAGQILTYVDPDLLFFSSPQPIFDELGTHSVLIHKDNPQKNFVNDIYIYIYITQA